MSSFAEVSCHALLRLRPGAASNRIIDCLVGSPKGAVHEGIAGRECGSALPALNGRISPSEESSGPARAYDDRAGVIAHHLDRIDRPHEDRGD